MNPLRHIRTQVFGLTQVEMAAISGVSQATISKWESGITAPTSHELQRIRETAAKRGLGWNDSWFFEVPETTE